MYRGRADYMIGRGDEAVYEESEGLTVEGTQVVAQGPVGVSQFIIDALLAVLRGSGAIQACSVGSKKMSCEAPDN